VDGRPVKKLSSPIILLSFDMEPMEAGNKPENELVENSNFVIELIPANMSGTVPENEFLLISIFSRPVRAERDNGIDPVKSFLSSSRELSEVSVPKKEGIVPWKLLSLRLNMLTTDKLEKDGGIVPDIALSLIRNFSIYAIWANTSGTVPPNEFLRKNISTKLVRQPILLGIVPVNELVCIFR